MRISLQELISRAKFIHYYSGLTLTIFIGLHLYNHFLSVFGAEAHIEFMSQFRNVYRHVVVEALLMAAVLLQLASGIRLVKVGKPSAAGFYDKLHIWSGIYLAIFLIIHVSAVLFARNLLNLDTNLYFGIAGLNTFPFSLFFIPYYSLGILSFFGHIAAIHAKKMKYTILGLSVHHQSLIILVVAVFITGIILFGLTNHFAGFEIPEEYFILINK
jgi:hypothetical protein